MWLQPAPPELLLDEAEELGPEPAALWVGRHPGSAVAFSGCVVETMKFAFFAEQEAEDLETGGEAVVPFVGVLDVQSLGYAGDELEYKPAQHSVIVVYWIECFAVRTVGALAELVSVGCKVLVWKSSDQAADLAV